MFFCKNCGTQLQDGTNACPNCGTFVNETTNMNNKTNNGNYPNYYVKPKIPGRGLGISGMVLSIIGLYFSFGFTVLVSEYIEFLDKFPVYDEPSSDAPGLNLFIIYSIFAILGLILSGTSRSKGYRNGISMSGLIMGIIGTVLYLISIVLYASTF